MTQQSSKSETTPMIQLEGIVKRYSVGGSTVAALNGVNLQIEKGEFVSIMGPSGSGKSTLMQILGALDTPTEGTYTLEGYDITRLPDTELARIRNQHFGFVFQSYNLFPDLTALENVELPLVYAGIHSKARIKQAAAFLDAVGLTDRLRHYPAQLSGGQQQRVAIARAIVTEPSLLLADEPTGNLSREGSHEILSIFDQLHNNGMSVVLVTHDLHVGSFAKRCIKLIDGIVVTDASVKERTVLEVF